MATTELERSTQSHFFWWARCVEALNEELIAAPEPARSQTVEVLAQVWRLLPTYRLKQVYFAIRRLP